MTDFKHSFLEDEGVIIVVIPGGYNVDFKVFDAAWCSDDNRPLIMDNGAPYPLETWKDRFWVWGGYVKWDGCSNWQTNPDCMAHFCGPNQGEDLATIWQEIYRLAANNLTECGAGWLREPKA